MIILRFLACGEKKKQKIKWVLAKNLNSNYNEANMVLNILLRVFLISLNKCIVKKMINAAD